MMGITFKKFSNPILFVGDNPALPGGLSRIGRDLATLACTMPEFRVGYLGRGVGQLRKLPFQLYDYPESWEWGQPCIEAVWNDFCDGDDGVIITLDDPSRRHWFAQGDRTPLARFLGPGRNFKKWGYFPIDSVGPSLCKLPAYSIDTLLGYDRVLVASEWANEMVGVSGVPNVDWLPHGYFGDKFKTLSSQDKIIKVGCVMANQSRKDFPVAFNCFSQLKSKYGNKFQAWLHTDVLSRYWDVPSLAMDYGIGDCLLVTQDLSDDQLALHYSTCSCTILPTGGEGFGYPIVESMACGTPCVVPDYSAAPEKVQPSCRVTPTSFRVDTKHNVVRAVLLGTHFLQRAVQQIERKQSDWVGTTEECASLVAHLEWAKLSIPWKRWFRKGLYEKV